MAPWGWEWGWQEQQQLQTQWSRGEGAPPLRRSYQPPPLQLGLSALSRHRCTCLAASKPAGCPQGRWVEGRDQHGTPHPNTAAQPWLPALVMGLFNPQLCQAARYFLVHLVISSALTDSNVWLASHRRLIRS